MLKIGSLREFGGEGPCTPATVSVRLARLAGMTNFSTKIGQKLAYRIFFVSNVTLYGRSYEVTFAAASNKKARAEVSDAILHL